MYFSLLLCYSHRLTYSNVPINMATDNRGVMVYLSPELERELQQYCIDRNITRKNKDGDILPALGTGIVQHLKSTLLSVSPSLSLSTVSHSPTSTSPSNIPANRLSTGLTKSEILELIVQSNTNQIPSTLLTRADVISIVRAEIDRSQHSTETEVTNEMMLAAATPSPLECAPTDPTNWEEPIIDLVSRGISSRQIADELNQQGFTNTKGGAVSRQSIESYLTRHPDLKATYENARKKGD